MQPPTLLLERTMILAARKKAGTRWHFVFVMLNLWKFLFHSTFRRLPALKCLLVKVGLKSTVSLYLSGLEQSLIYNACFPDLEPLLPVYHLYDTETAPNCSRQHHGWYTVRVWKLLGMPPPLNFVFLWILDKQIK